MGPIALTLQVVEELGTQRRARSENYRSIHTRRGRRAHTHTHTRPSFDFNSLAIPRTRTRTVQNWGTLRALIKALIGHI